MRWLALTTMVIVNIAVLVWAAMPFFLTYAEVPPQGVTCSVCGDPEVQRALARAAAVGRGQILVRVEAVFPVVAGLTLLNLAFLIGFGLTYGRRRAA